MGVRKYSDEELIDFYKQLANKLGRKPRHRDFIEENGNPSSKTYCNRFGGIDNLARLCGFDTKITQYTKDELLQLLKNYIDKNGIPKSRKYDFVPGNNLPAYKTYQDYFGKKIKLIDLVKMVGYQLTKEEEYQIISRGSQIHYTKEEVIEKVKQMQIKLNRPLMYDDFRNPTWDSVGIQHIKKYFGTMNKMKEELELEIIQESMIDRTRSKEQMLDELQQFIYELGRIPKSRELANNPNMLNESAYYRYFGGLNNALILLGYKPIKEFPARDLTNQDIIDMYKEFIDDLGFVPSYDLCCKLDSIIHPKTILRRLNCKWNEFIEMLGYKPNEQIICSEITYARDGAMCLSSSERYIHEWFLDNKQIKIIDKEGYYKDFLSDSELQKEAGYLRYDWLVSINKKTYLVEYFGMMDFADYNRRHDLKLSLIEGDNKIDQFIPLYRKHINKLDVVFQEVIKCLK